jgi:hypothetical protein
VNEDLQNLVKVLVDGPGRSMHNATVKLTFIVYVDSFNTMFMFEKYLSFGLLAKDEL